MVPSNDPDSGEDERGFFGRYQLPFRARRPDDDVAIDDDWLRREGHIVQQFSDVIIELDDGGSQWGNVLVRTDDGWIYESPWPEYLSVILVPQPSTRGDLRRVIATLIACRKSRGSLDIFDALHIGFTTQGDSFPCL